jgi:hypothetical protein
MVEAPVQITDEYVRKYLWEHNLVAIDEGDFRMLSKREWQGLTDKERNDCLVEADPCEALLDHEAHELMRTIEAKLKEKNRNG